MKRSSTLLGALFSLILVSYSLGLKHGKVGFGRDLLSTMNGWFWIGAKKSRKLWRAGLRQLENSRGDVTDAVGSVKAKIDAMEDKVKGIVKDHVTNSKGDVAAAVWNVIEKLDAMEDKMKDHATNMTGGVSRKTRLVEIAVSNFYSQTTLDTINARFHVIMETVTPDFTSLWSLCPVSSSTCNNCPLPLVVCRLCCPSLPPLGMQDMAKESSSSSIMTGWLSSSLWKKGVYSIYQSWLHPAREQYSSKTTNREIAALVRNFQWLYTMKQLQAETTEEVAWSEVAWSEAAPGNVEQISLDHSSLCGLLYRPGHA